MLFNPLVVIYYEELLNNGWVSKEFLYKRVLKMSQEEIEEIQKQIKSEKTNSLYKDIKLGDSMDGGFGNDGGYQNNTADEEDDSDEENDVEDVEDKKEDDEQEN